MAIVHFAMKSSSAAPPSRGHAEYITASDRYEQKQGVELVEHGNMPVFATAEPLQFWSAADAQERANGRTYTEIQFALPRELSRDKQIELARTASKEFLGERHAYTLAVHAPDARDGKEQPHAHLMFSERKIDERTRELPAEQFFKRNGATKDRMWNDKAKPEELREKWCQMMNQAMRENHSESQVDHRNYEQQGREDLAALREPKIGYGPGAEERAAQVEQLREERAETLTMPQQTPEQVEQQAAKRIEAIEQQAKRELSLIDRAIAEVKVKYEQAKQYVREKFEGWQAQNTPETPTQTAGESPPRAETFVEKFRREQAEKIEERRKKQQQDNQTNKPRHTQ
jgi:hypothetical protein